MMAWYMNTEEFSRIEGERHLSLAAIGVWSGLVMRAAAETGHVPIDQAEAAVEDRYFSVAELWASGVDPESVIVAAIAELAQAGLVEERDGRWAPRLAGVWKATPE